MTFEHRRPCPCSVLIPSAATVCVTVSLCRGTRPESFFLSGVSSCCVGPPKIYLKKYISTHTYYIHLYYYRCCYFNRAKFLSFKKNLPNQKGRLLFYSLDYYMVSKTFLYQLHTFFNNKKPCFAQLHIKARNNLNHMSFCLQQF